MKMIQEVFKETTHMVIKVSRNIKKSSEYNLRSAVTVYKYSMCNGIKMSKEKKKQHC
jgi:hypothetical protein